LGENPEKTNSERYKVSVNEGTTVEKNSGLRPARSKPGSEKAKNWGSAEVLNGVREGGSPQGRKGGGFGKTKSSTEGES